MYANTVSVIDQEMIIEHGIAHGHVTFSTIIIISLCSKPAKHSCVVKLSKCSHIPKQLVSWNSNLFDGHGLIGRCWNASIAEPRSS